MTSTTKKIVLLWLLCVVHSQGSSVNPQTMIRNLAENSNRHLPGGILVQYKDSGDFQHFTCHDAENDKNCGRYSNFRIPLPATKLGYLSQLRERFCFCFKDSGECLILNPKNPNLWEKFVTLPFDDSSEKIEHAMYFQDRAVFYTSKGHLYEVLPSGNVLKHNVRWQSPVICGAGDGERDYAITKRSSKVIEVWYISTERKWETHYLSVSEAFGTAGCVATDDEIYMAGGRHADGSPSDSVYVINTKTWKVEELQGSGKLPTPSDNVKMAMVGNKPAAFGVNSSDGKSKQVFTYDKTSNSWTISTLKLNKDEQLHSLYQA